MSSADLFQRIPLGYSRAHYRDQTWGVSHVRFAHGRSGKIFGEQLGGTDFVSCNYYLGRKRIHLKPCEMPEAKVLHFLRHAHFPPPVPENPAKVLD